MTDVRDNFAKALRDELTSSERAEFERAIGDDPTLAREFEAYADAQEGELENVSAWLEHTGRASAIEYHDAYDHMVKDVIDRAHGRKRGRLIQLVGAIGAVAAAAAIVAVLIMPADTVTEDWPGENTESVHVLYDNYLHYSADVEEFTPAEGVTLSIHNGALIRPHERGARLDRGEVTVKLEEDAQYDIHVGDRRIEATGPAEFKVTAEPHRLTHTQFIKPENDPMLDARLLSRFGAQGFALTLSMIAGSSTLHGAQPPRTVNAPQVIQEEVKPPKAKHEPKVEDIFSHLDGNSDGKLDSAEVPQHMIDDFDDDRSGNINLHEFKEHHKPQQPGDKPKIEDHFKHLDINKDGKLDNSEIPQDMLDNLDGDSSGDVDLDEFKENHKPPKPKKPEDAFADMDKNSDGKLDSNELPKALVQDWDDDDSGDVDLEEFKKNHKPPHRGPGRGPGGEGPGEGRPPRGEGPGKGPPPGGKGPGGKPPRE